MCVLVCTRDHVFPCGLCPPAFSFSVSFVVQSSNYLLLHIHHRQALLSPCLFEWIRYFQKPINIYELHFQSPCDCSKATDSGCLKTASQSCLLGCFASAEGIPMFDQRPSGSTNKYNNQIMKPACLAGRGGKKGYSVIQMALWDNFKTSANSFHPGLICRSYLKMVKCCWGEVHSIFFVLLLFSHFPSVSNLLWILAVRLSF